MIKSLLIFQALAILVFAVVDDACFFASPWYGSTDLGIEISDFFSLKAHKGENSKISKITVIGVTLNGL
jgi:hypothetical protein